MTTPALTPEAQDAEYQRTHFTGVVIDPLLPREHVGYLNGVATVWGNTYTETDARLREVMR